MTYDPSDQEFIPKPNSGNLMVSLSSGMTNTTVVIDGKIIADKKHTKEIEIVNIPVGKHTVQVFGADPERNGLTHKEEILIQDKQTTHIYLATPGITASAIILAITAGIVAFFAARWAFSTGKR